MTAAAEYARSADLPRRSSAIERRWRRLLRFLLGAVAALIVIAAGGAGYEWLASAGDAVASPITGRLVDVGGHQLYLDCQGEGSPTVVLDAGLGGSSLDWSLVQPDLAQITRVCSYDRAGMGHSEPGPQPRSPATIAAELHRLLETAGVAGPYLLVGHSLAGKNIRMFAAAHPDAVAGMVLLDARSERVEAESDQQAFVAALEGQALVYALARRLDVVRLFGAGLIGEPTVDATRARRLVLAQTEPNAIAATTDEGLARTANDGELSVARVGNIPLTVVAADESMHKLPGWSEAQIAMAGLSTRGRLVVAEGSDHAIQFAQPQLVVTLIKDMVLGLRADGR
jgi:pimeloyl-ACP methyl ester carboxylesterase